MAVSPTAPLSQEIPIAISMSPRYLAHQREITRLGINVGTHMRTTCMVYVYADGTSQFTEGCPTPGLR